MTNKTIDDLQHSLNLLDIMQQELIDVVPDEIFELSLPVKTLLLKILNDILTSTSPTSGKLYMSDEEWNKSF